MTFFALRAALRRRYSAHRRRKIAAAIRSILTDTTGRHRRRVYVRKGGWMDIYLTARRCQQTMNMQHARCFHFQDKTRHRAATTPHQTERAATAGAIAPPLAPAGLTPNDLSRGTLGREWIEDQIARAAFNGNKGS